MFTKRGKLLTIAILILNLFILIDHFKVHNGIYWQNEDFIRAITNSINSHEGIVFLLSFLLLGIIIADYHRSKKKR